MKAYTLKIRGGIEVDTYGKKAGKGALVQEELSATLGVSQDQYLFQPVIDVEMEVAVRKHEVDTEKLSELLRKHKTMSIDEIAEATDRPKTLVEHWFRKDKYFAIPDPKAWRKLKEILGIVTDEFDKAITEFEYKGGNYDMRNRIYAGQVAPTLTTDCKDHLHLLPVGVDCYNLKLTGDKGRCLATPSGGLNEHIPCVITGVFENHSQDTRFRGPLEIIPTINAGYGTGGNNQPLVVFSKSRRAKSKDDFETWKLSKVSNTLNTFDRGDIRATDVVIGFQRQLGGVEAHENQAPSILAAAGTSGNNQPCLCMATQQGGAEIGDNVCPTITAAAGMSGNNQPVVAYLGSGENVTGCLMASGYGKLGQQEMFSGNYTVIEERKPCYSTSKGSFHLLLTQEKVGSLLSSDYKDPPIVIMDRAAYNQGKNAQYNFYAEVGGIMPTVIAKGPGAVCYPKELSEHCAEATTKELAVNMSQTEKLWWNGNQVANTITARSDVQRMPDKGHLNCVIEERGMTDYIVRRLTPTECSRLQGFPDGWAEIDPKEDFTEEEYKFWLEVRNTHAKINGKQIKEYTKAQMLTWYNKLHTDSAEYKMWGNGIALPNALYVMQGIAEQENRQDYFRRAGK